MRIESDSHYIICGSVVKKKGEEHRTVSAELLRKKFLNQFPAEEVLVIF